MDHDSPGQETRVIKTPDYFAGESKNLREPGLNDRTNQIPGILAFYSNTYTVSSAVIISPGASSSSGLYSLSISTARVRDMLSPIARSPTRCSPPRGSTAVSLSKPLLKILTEVIPDPISIRIVPNSFSAGVSNAYELARGCRPLPERQGRPGARTQLNLQYLLRALLQSGHSSVPVRELFVLKVPVVA